MKGSLVANRYAQALLELASEQNKLDNVYNDMLVIKSVVEENRDLANLLKSPVVKTDKKLSILKQIFGNNIGELTTEFVQLLSSRKRESILDDVAKAFIAQYKKEKNIVVAEITSAVKLNDEQKNKIIKLLNYENVTFEIEEKIDPSILGGFVVRVEDKQIDASIAREFNDLRKQLILN